MGRDSHRVITNEVDVHHISSARERGNRRRNGDDVPDDGEKDDNDRKGRSGWNRAAHVSRRLQETVQEKRVSLERHR